MKKILGCVAIGCLTPLAALVILGLVLPGEWSVERSVLIDAPPEAIHPLVENFHRWGEWVQSHAEGTPDTTITYSGAQQGKDAVVAWEGGAVGTGRLHILESDPAHGIQYESAIESQRVNGSGSISFIRTDQGTQVIWKDGGKLPPVVGGLFSWFVNAGLEKQFASDLARLKKAVEGPTPADPAPEKPGE